MKSFKFQINIIWLILLVMFLFYGLSYLYGGYQENKKIIKPSQTELVKSIGEGKVTSIEVRGSDVFIEYKNKTKGYLKKETASTFEEVLINLGVNKAQLQGIDFRVNDEKGFKAFFKKILPFLFPVLLLIIMLLFLSRQGGMGSQLFNFGRSRARMIDPNDKSNRITFADVAGLQEEKEELREFVDFLKYPQKFLAIGAKVPKGVLLTGNPGTGKTLLARAVAGEANVPFFSISGSEFVEMFVGVGASRVRDLFQTAKRTAPAIIFIDEIDAIGRHRGGGTGGGNDEREQTLNQILVEMDGFEPSSKVIIIAATNRSDVLDAALLRPGRFDRKILVDLPDLKEREAILAVHIRNKQMADKIDLSVVARRTAGSSGAELSSIINEAAIFAVRAGREKIMQDDLLSAIDKVYMGPEKKSRIYTEEDKRLVAYHEVGHALISSILKYSDPVQKITLIPRGMAGGYTMFASETDKKFKNKEQLFDELVAYLGGYVAERVVFGTVSTGPRSDLTQATSIAHSMVTEYGMSDAVGPITLRRMNRLNGLVEKHSVQTEVLIDQEVKKLLQLALARAEKLFRKYRKAADALVRELFTIETIEREAYETLLRKFKVPIGKGG